MKLLIVDVADDFDDVASEATRARLRAYADRGWHVQVGPKWLPLWPERRACGRKQRSPKAVMESLLAETKS